MKTIQNAVAVTAAEMCRVVWRTTGGGCGLDRQLAGKVQRSGGLQAVNAAWAVSWPEYKEIQWTYRQ